MFNATKIEMEVRNAALHAIGAIDAIKDSVWMDSTIVVSTVCGFIKSIAIVVDGDFDLFWFRYFSLLTQATRNSSQALLCGVMFTRMMSVWYEFSCVNHFNNSVFVVT